MKKLLLFLVIFTINFKISHAQTYFDYLSKNTISYDGYHLVNLKYHFGENIKPDRFLIKPVVDNGSVKIFNKDNGIWINSGEFWTSMPDLNDEIKIYVASQNRTIGLNFEIMDKLSGKIYSTPNHEIWTHFAYQDYLAKLNENISKW